MRTIILKFGVLILAISLLQACKDDNEMISYDVNWGERSDSAIERLEENGIKYEVNDGIIYIQDKDLNKAQSCCS